MPPGASQYRCRMGPLGGRSHAQSAIEGGGQVVAPVGQNGGGGDALAVHGQGEGHGAAAGRGAGGARASGVGRAGGNHHAVVPAHIELVVLAGDRGGHVPQAVVGLAALSQGGGAVGLLDGEVSSIASTLPSAVIW